MGLCDCGGSFGMLGNLGLYAIITMLFCIRELGTTLELYEKGKLWAKYNSIVAQWEFASFFYNFMVFV